MGFFGDAPALAMPDAPSASKRHSKYAKGHILLHAAVLTSQKNARKHRRSSNAPKKSHVSPPVVGDCVWIFIGYSQQFHQGILQRR